MNRSIVRRIESWTISAWLLVALPAGAQQVVNLPAEDRWLEADSEELYRVGTLLTGEDWEQFGRVRSLAFDGAGNLHIFDEQARRGGRHGYGRGSVAAPNRPRGSGRYGPAERCSNTHKAPPRIQPGAPLGSPSGWSRGVLGLVELGVQTVVVKRVVAANPRP